MHSFPAWLMLQLVPCLLSLLALANACFGESHIKLLNIWWRALTPPHERAPQGGEQCSLEALRNLTFKLSSPLMRRKNCIYCLVFWWRHTLWAFFFVFRTNLVFFNLWWTFFGCPFFFNWNVKKEEKNVLAIWKQYLSTVEGKMCFFHLFIFSMPTVLVQNIVFFFLSIKTIICFSSTYRLSPHLC